MESVSLGGATFPREEGEHKGIPGVDRGRHLIKDNGPGVGGREAAGRLEGKKFGSPLTWAETGLGRSGSVSGMWCN